MITILILTFFAPPLILGGVAGAVSSLFGANANPWLNLFRGAGAALLTFAGEIAGSLAGYIFEQATSASSEIVLYGMIVGGLLGGVLGAIFAVPAIRILYVFARWLARKAGVAGLSDLDVFA